MRFEYMRAPARRRERIRFEGADEDISAIVFARLLARERGGSDSRCLSHGRGEIEPGTRVREGGTPARLKVWSLLAGRQRDRLLLEVVLQTHPTAGDPGPNVGDEPAARPLGRPDVELRKALFVRRRTDRLLDTHLGARLDDQIRVLNEALKHVELAFRSGRCDRRALAQLVRERLEGRKWIIQEDPSLDCLRLLMSDCREPARPTHDRSRLDVVEVHAADLTDPGPRQLNRELGPIRAEAEK